MSVKRIQNKIADSRLALPVTAIYAVLVCLISGFITQHLWAQFAILIVSTYMMLELNNTNALIRIYSRMVSCSYLMLAVMGHFLLVSVPLGPGPVGDCTSGKMGLTARRGAVLF